MHFTDDVDAASLDKLWWWHWCHHTQWWKKHSSRQQGKECHLVSENCSRKKTQVKTPDFHAWPICAFWKWLELLRMLGHFEWVKEAVTWRRPQHIFSSFWLSAVLGYACIFLRHSWITKHWQWQGQEHRHLTSCNYPTKMPHSSHLGLEQWPSIMVKLSWNSVKAEQYVQLLSWKQCLTLFSCTNA